MRQDFLRRDIRYLKGVGENRAKLFAKLGVDDVGALLRYCPRDYIDLRTPVLAASAPVDAPCVLRLTIASKSPAVRLKGSRTLTQLRAFDDSAEVRLSFFNNTYTPASLAVSGSYCLYGRVSGGLIAREMINPMLIKPSQMKALTPVYPLTQGLSSGIIANAVRAAFELAGGELEETLPRWILEKYSLEGLSDALFSIHFPQSAQQLESARRRLAFEELLTLQLGFARLKANSRAANGLALKMTDASEFTASLPFELTGAQKRSIAEISAYLGQSVPMNCLLQGDVGSGKTVVAAAAAFLAKNNGLQSAVMAPTEILAAQHADTFAALLSPFGVSVGLLTASVKGKKRELLLQKIKSGEVDVVCGTHAVIEEGVTFSKLGFVVADEQHRFGVAQRLALAHKGNNPHMLVMSATPIPRTLALLVYGELDISVLDELPKGRKPIKTLLVDKSLRERYLNFVRETAKKGRGAYIVCPLVSESEALGEVEAATEYFETIKVFLPELNIGLLHGKMKPADKNRVLCEFRDKKLSALVCTTVVEVGVDVPHTTLMIIENAERFGLSQLHQLRGRVGRSDEESYCVLVSDKRSRTSFERLKVMCESTDGFEIARADLKARGPGDFFGRRQHGLPAMSLAASVGDEKTVYDAAGAAAAISADDPTLSKPEYIALREAVGRMFSDNAIFN